MYNKKMEGKEELKCKLTEKEKVDLGSELAVEVKEIARLESEKKSIASQYKGKIDERMDRLGSLAALVNDGYEIREVDILIIFDYDKGIVSKVRKDTGEEYESRPMTLNERQKVLHFRPRIEDGLRTAEERQAHINRVWAEYEEREEKEEKRL